MTTPTPFIDPPKPPLWQRTWARITAAVIVALVAIGAATGDDPEPTGNDTAAVTTTTGQAEVTAPPTTERTTTTRPRPTTTTADTRRADMAEWANDNLPVISLISDVFGTISDAASIADLDGIEQGCRDLADLVASAQASLPVPEPSVDAPWRLALTTYARAADLCIQGAISFDPDLIAESAGLFSQAADHVAEASAAVETFLGAG